MVKVLIILAVIVALLLLYLAVLNGHYSVRRSLEIGASRKSAFDRITDFNSWPTGAPG
jgi:hypothetical protein